MKDARSRAEYLFDEFLAHGEAMVDRLICEQVSEELFIDYKRSSDDGGGQKLHQNDRENFGKAISGFGNSEGGIIIWGVGCRRDPERGDLPDRKHALKSPKRFVSWLEGTASGCTLPPHNAVRHHAVTDKNDEGYVVSFIPQSSYSPHQCIVGKHEKKYFVRTGSDFVPASHGLLASMFGRQPAPKLSMSWGLAGKMAPDTLSPLITGRPTAAPHVCFSPAIRNAGIAVARDLYANFRISTPGPNCHAEINHEQGHWIRYDSNWAFHLISQEGFRLAPDGIINPFEATIYLQPPFENQFTWDLTVGCANAPLQKLGATIPAEIIEKAFNEFLGGRRSSAEGVTFAVSIFDLAKVGEAYRGLSEQ